MRDGLGTLGFLLRKLQMLHAQPSRRRQQHGRQEFVGPEVVFALDVLVGPDEEVFERHAARSSVRARQFAALTPLRRSEWVVYAKRPFAGPKAVLAYLARYTHRVAISNSRLVTLDEAGVTFKWKDYRIKGRDRLRTMTLDAAEFIRRFLLHVLPSGFHRIRHYGLFASAGRAHNIERARHLLASPERSRAEADSEDETASPARQCPCCGGRMIVVETFEGARPARSPAPTGIRIDTS